MSDDPIFLTRSSPVATIHLNSPSKRNALNMDMWQRLMAAVDEVEADAAIKVVIVTGEGGAFAAGADIEEFGKTFADPTAAETAAQTTYNAQKRLYRCKKPTIAKIRGACVGGGCGIALCCDIRMADSTARFGITPARLGLFYTLSDTKRLVDVVGPSRAKDILYTGRILSAEEAYSVRLIDTLVSDNGLDAAVTEYAELICENSQYSIRATKGVVQNILDGESDDGPENLKRFADAFSEPDFAEGHAAFMGKRKPAFPFF